jgi:hypothetical protein
VLYSVAEIRRLIIKLASPPLPPEAVRAWSRWRRGHQTRARTCHYRRRQLNLNLLL